METINTIIKLVNKKIKDTNTTNIVEYYKLIQDVYEEYLKTSENNNDIPYSRK